MTMKNSNNKSTFGERLKQLKNNVISHGKKIVLDPLIEDKDMLIQGGNVVAAELSKNIRRVKDKIEAESIKYQERQRQKQIMEEIERREFESSSVRHDAIVRQITDMEHARKKRHSLLKSGHDQSIAENESKVSKIEEAALENLKASIHAIPTAHAEKLKISKTIHHIDILAKTTIFDETEEEKEEKRRERNAEIRREAYIATGKVAGEVAKEIAKNPDAQKFVADAAINFWEKRKNKKP